MEQKPILTEEQTAALVAAMQKINEVLIELWEAIKQAFTRALQEIKKFIKTFFQRVLILHLITRYKIPIEPATWLVERLPDRWLYHLALGVIYDIRQRKEKP